MYTEVSNDVQPSPGSTIRSHRRRKSALPTGSFVALSILLQGAPPLHAQQQVSASDRLRHEEMLVLDTHLDTPRHFERPGWKFDEWHEPGFDGSQVDIPRMQAGGLDGGFFVIYVAQGELTPAGYSKARDEALMRAVSIQRVVAAHEELAMATTAADAERLHKEGKKIVYQAIENSYPLGEDLSLLETFRNLGVRMASPVHNGNNQFADSARNERPQWNGLSPLGRRWVAEMNRLGMIIDASHASDTTLDQLIAVSATPIILSHSGPRALFDHPRNLDDERMRRLARAGGVMQLNSVFLAPVDTSAEASNFRTQQEKWEFLTIQQRRQLLSDKAAHEARRLHPRPDFDLFMRHLLHAIRVMGVDHVGLGADWDGGGGVQGLEDVSMLPRITARLRKEGFSDADISKIWSGNVLRLLRKAEAHALSLQPGRKKAS